MFRILNNCLSHLYVYIISSGNLFYLYNQMLPSVNQTTISGTQVHG